MTILIDDREFETPIYGEAAVDLATPWAGGPVDVDALRATIRETYHRASFLPIDLRATFDEAEHPRDEGGKWTDGDGSGGGRATVVHVRSVHDAIPLILAGQVVELKNPRKVNSLLTKLAALAKDAEAKGEHAPNYDACKITVKGVSFFCGGNLGHDRIVMPQLSGDPRPGSQAAKIARDDKGRVDIAPEFLDHLAKLGIGHTSENVRASSLIASQRQLVGPEIARRVAKKDWTPNGPIFISRDNYIVDGHHRWASVVGRDADDGHLGDLKLRAIRLDAPITEVLKIAQTWTVKFGLGGRGVGKSLAFDVDSVDLAAFDESDHPRDADGKFASGGGGHTAAEVETLRRYLGSVDPPEGMYVADAVNGLLRGVSRYGNTIDLTPAQRTFYDREIAQLQHAIEKTPTTTDRVFYRGVTAGLVARLTDGTVFTDHGFTSIASDRAIAQERFTGFSAADKGRVYEVHVPKGTPLLDVDRLANPKADPEYTTETEHLLGHGTRFRVSGSVLTVLR